MRTISIALVIWSFASAAHAEAPPSGSVFVDIIAASGFGCPVGGIAISMSPDNMELLLNDGGQAAQVGGGAGPADARKVCNLILRLHAPQGFLFGINSVTYRGFASLAAGATGLARGAFSFSGQTARPVLSRRFSGPFLDDWELTNTLAVILLSPPPCGQPQPNLNIATELQVDAGTSDPTTTISFLSRESLDGQAPSRYLLLWQRCP